MFEFAATGAPAIKTTLPPVFTTGVTIARFLLSAFVDASVHVALPLAFEAPQVPSVLFVPSAENVGVSPAMGLLNTSAR